MYSKGFNLNDISSSAKSLIPELVEKELITLKGDFAFATLECYDVDKFDVSLFHIL